MKKIFPFVAVMAMVSTLSSAETLSTDSIYKLDDVLISGKRGMTTEALIPQAVTIIDREQLDSRYESQVLTSLSEMVPGLFSTQRSVLGYGISTGAAGGINIRGIGGTNSAQILMLVDGHPQYAALMGHPVADTYQVPNLKRIEVVRGPASVLYGSNAMGGTINLITDNARTVDGASGEARVMYGSYNSLQSSLSVKNRNGKFYEQASMIYNMSDGHRDNMGFEQMQGNLNLGYDINDNWMLSANVNSARIISHNPGTVASPVEENEAKIIRGVASVQLDNVYEGFNGSVSAFHNWGDHSINDGHGVGETEKLYRFHSLDKLSGISAYESFDMFWNGNTTTFGVDYTHAQGDTWFAWKDGTISSPWRKDLPKVEKESDEIAGFVSMEQKLSTGFYMNAGIRYVYHSLNGDVWVPAAGLVYRYGPNQVFKLSASKGYRNPTFKDMYLFKIANEDLMPEELMNYEFNWSGLFMDDRLRADASIYYIDGKNVIVPVAGKNTNSGEIENYGFDIDATYKINNHISLSGNYSFLHMENPIVAAPEHKAYLAGSWHSGKVALNAGVQYVGGLYTNVTEGAEEQQDYLLMNARASYKENEHLTIFVKGENLLNQDYCINAGYPMPGATVMAGINLGF